MQARRKVTRRAVLVYQAGIANVFEVANFACDPTERVWTARIRQGDFRSCENFARGLRFAGFETAVTACNEAGDIEQRSWSCDFEDGSAPFRSAFQSADIDDRQMLPAKAVTRD